MAAARAEAHPLGIALHDPGLPDKWVLNQLYVVGPHPQLGADELLAELDRLYGGLAHRRVAIGDDSTGRRLTLDLRHAGFAVERHAVMLLGDSPAPPVPGAAREAGEDEFAGPERAVTLDDPEDAAAADTLISGRRRIRAARAGTRRFIGSRDGVDACTVTLFSGDGIAQVEDVSTLSTHRRRGLAAATIALAVQAALDAGNELVFIVVDADSGPVALYQRLGFRTAGQSWVFTRRG